MQQQLIKSTFYRWFSVSPFCCEIFLMMFEAQMCYFASFKLIFFAMGKHNAVHERMDHQYQRLFGVSQSCFHQISFWIWTLQSPTFAGMSSLPLYSQGCWWSWGCRQPCKQWSAVWTSSPPKRLGSQYQIIYLWMATGYQTDSRRKRHNVLWRCCTNCPLLIRVLLLL